MLLYHGTSEYAALQAMKVGLRPRQETGVSNWAYESNKDVIYLTTTYACHYALNAKQNGVRITGPDGKIQNRMAIIEIDTARLPFLGFRADEDFLAFRQAYSSPEHESSSVKTLVEHHAANLTNEWKESLKSLGTCSYSDVINPRHFSRVAFFDPKANQEMAFAMMDGNVSPPAFKWAGHYHRAYTRWLFGDPVTTLEVLGYEGIDIDSMPGQKEKIKYWDNVLKNREGIQIIQCKK